MEVKIGKIVNTQGIKGEVRVLSNSDFKEIRFRQGTTLSLKTKNGILNLVIETSRQHKTFRLIKFLGYDNINDVLQFKNVDIYGPEIDKNALQENEYLNKDLVNCRVFDQNGEELGIVEEVIENLAHNLLRIVGKEKNFLVPFNENFVTKVDVYDRIIVVEVIPGLID